MQDFESNIGYTFKNKELLETALTHSSFANEKKNQPSYERLEFLGDALLGFICAEYLFTVLPDTPEGELTQKRASVVCEKALCTYSRELSIGKYMKLSKGEASGGGRERVSILADMFEAVLAAIYMDGGIEEAKKFALRFLTKKLDASKSNSIRDYKTALQEIVQQNPDESVEYVMLGESGPEHNKKFTCAVRLHSNTLGKGSGRTKKEAEQQAAREALELMGY